LERGKRERTPSLDVFIGASPSSRSRLGLIVPKHGRRIVDRNLLKRRLREIGRRNVLPRLAAAGVSVDVLIRARHRAYTADYDRLAEEVNGVVEALWSSKS
jgi:ribonuclease P protein component